MATWFKQFKTKHWDGEVYKNPPNSPVVFIGISTPPARRFWQEHRPEIKKGMWYVFFAVVAAAILKLAHLT
ncbi:hypothetical protein [Variovorax saccharolyticus]|uniref:hypothetical protein n=1 Tax=Variovorax saccharolyticus TaxID=3053516 RepID=UPI0025751FA1|nr:hypothetical protein [Variovorax sp. J22R187]MDM0018173.1 hypothetical protein [Variovorax sp. J22R187]